MICLSFHTLIFYLNNFTHLYYLTPFFYSYLYLFSSNSYSYFSSCTMLSFLLFLMVERDAISMITVIIGA